MLIGSDNGRHEQEALEALELECPLCRQPCEVDGSNRAARCGHCGRPLVSSARTSEAEAWIQLYGRVPVRGG